MGGLSIWHWLIVLVIVVLVFGTKRLKNVGKDVGEAVKGFKQGMDDDKGPPGQLGDESRNEQHRTEQPRDGQTSEPQRKDDDAPR